MNFLKQRNVNKQMNFLKQSLKKHVSSSCKHETSSHSSCPIGHWKVLCMLNMAHN